MVYTIIFISIIIGLILIKMRDISKRNNLQEKDEKKLVIAGALLILFLITNVTLPYPQSMYWFVFAGIILVGSLLCVNILKNEAKKFKKLKFKDQLLNVLFYSLFFTVIHIYI